MFKGKQAVPKAGTSASPRSSTLQSTSAQEPNPRVKEILSHAMGMKKNPDFIEKYNEDPNAALNILSDILVDQGFALPDVQAALRLFYQHISSISKAASLTSAMQKMKIKAPTKPQLAPEIRLAFQDVYSTNVGFTAINKSLRSGKISLISASDVQSEITRRHGDAVFYGQDGKSILQDIKSVIKDWNRGMTSIYTDSVYNREGTRQTYSHRGQGLSAAGLEQLKSMKPGDIVHSKSIMSVSNQSDVAETFAAQSDLPDKLTYRILGTSALPNRGRNRVESEKESLFSPLASFKIVRFVEKRRTRNHILELEEIHPDQEVGDRQPIPY